MSCLENILDKYGLKQFNFDIIIITYFVKIWNIFWKELGMYVIIKNIINNLTEEK